MCPTPIGRIHTRVTTLVPGAFLATIAAILDDNPGWIVLIGVYLVMGVFLDAAIYPLVLRYQPPWMTGVLGLAEFGFLLVLGDVLEVGLTVTEATVLYWVTWLLAVCTKIVLLPIFSLTYLESSFEFRRAQWSIPPEQASLPVMATAAEANAGPGALVEQASGVNAAPLELKPSPSGVRPSPFAP